MSFLNHQYQHRHCEAQRAEAIQRKASPNPSEGGEHLPPSGELKGASFKGAGGCLDCFTPFAMTKNTILVFCFLMLATTGSCQKPPINPPNPPPSQPKFPTNLEIVWNAPFYSDSTYDYFWDYEIANNQYIVLANIFDRTYNKPRGIGIYNMQTGERHPAWKNDPGGIFSVTEVEDLYDCKVAGKKQDIILIYNKRALFGYSLHSGQRMWTLQIQNQSVMGNLKISTYGDYAFITYGPGGGLSKSWFRLAMVDVYSGKQTDILELQIEDNYEFDINPPSVYVTNEGDTLLYFTTSGLNFAEVKYRLYAYCYNLTKKQMAWVNKEFSADERAQASAFVPTPYLIENDILVIPSSRGIHCFNCHTGELLWQREGLSLSLTPPLYWEGKIYIRSGNPCILLCLDAQTGQQIWENTTLNPLPAFQGAMAIYKDRLYFSMSNGNATYGLACVDINTGKELWRDRGPTGNFGCGVLIDPKTGYLYCNTGWSTLCVDLNKTPKK